MKCGYSREILALYAYDDLPHPDAVEQVRRHVSQCADCEKYCGELERSGALLKARLKLCGQDMVTPQALAAVRGRVMSRLTRVFRIPRLAFAGLAIVAIVSVSLVAQIRSNHYRLGRPADYRQWVSLGKNVYMYPDAYQAFAKSGKFPDGTIMVKETESGLSVSLKDSQRFASGWAYFTFITDTAEPLPESAGCLSCHRQNAATDHVFTQFYPALKTGV